MRFSPSNLPRQEFLETVRGIARSTGSEARNAKWTSYSALELDIFSPAKADFELFIAAVRPLASTEFTKDLNQAPPFKTEGDWLNEARDLFNSERYWESHEVLEGIWRQKQGEEKRLLQGIILVCAAFVHHQKGEPQVAISVLRRAAKQLDFPSPSYDGFKLEPLRSAVQEILDTGRFSRFSV